MDASPIDRTVVTRHPERQREGKAELYGVLDAANVAHLAVSRADGPVVLPVLFARDGDRLLIHGSTGGGALRLAAAGEPVAVEATLLDGLVFAARAVNLSANYRSAVVLGRCAVVSGEDAIAALRLITERYMPGRWAEIGEPSSRELAATMVLELPLSETSVKVREGGPLDDAVPGVWRGELPIVSCTGGPITAPGSETEHLPASLLTAAVLLNHPGASA